jgi:DNA-binding transcriptional MerR regulator
MATRKKGLKTKAPAVDPRKLDQWKKNGQLLAKAKNANQWAIADWMCKGEDEFKKKKPYQVAATATGMTIGTLRQFAYTARHVLTRVNGLFFGHHRLVAEYTPEQQARFLKHAKDNGESVASFAAYLKTLKQDAEPETWSPADVAASKVIEACDSFLRSFRNDDFDTLLDERPSQSARTKVLDRLKDVIVELNNKMEELEAEWCVKARSAGAGK